MSEALEHPRLCELLERRWAGALSVSELGELEQLLDEIPDARAAADQLEREERAMERTIEAAVERFDFAKARRAIDAKLASDRRWLVLQAVAAGALLLIASASAAIAGAWAGVFSFILPAMVLSVLGRAWVVARQHGVAKRSGDAGRLEAAFRAHLSHGRQEVTIMRACFVIALLGMVVTTGTLLARGDFVRAGFCAAGAIVILIGARRYFGLAALARHERFLAGEQSRSAWLRGEDPGR